MKGFGQLGGFLRYNLDFMEEAENRGEDDEEDDGFNTDEDFI